VIDGLVARLVTLENQIKEMIEDKAAKTKKIDDLEKELRTASNNSSTSSNNLTSVNDSWANILKGNNKMNEVQTNILNVVGNEQNQRRRKERNVMTFGVPASKAATIELHISPYGDAILKKLKLSVIACTNYFQLICLLKDL
jgi:chromosome segregation ATPase